MVDEKDSPQRRCLRPVGPTPRRLRLCLSERSVLVRQGYGVDPAIGAPPAPLCPAAHGGPGALDGGRDDRAGQPARF